MSVYRKYYNLATYDHFSNLEEQKKAISETEKYIWGGEQVPEDIEDIKRAYHLRK